MSEALSDHWLPVDDEPGFGLWMAPDKMDDLNEVERHLWRVAGILSGHEEEEALARIDFKRGVWKSKVDKINAITNKLMRIEYVGAFLCIAVGFFESWPLRLYQVIRPCWLIAVARAELMIASFLVRPMVEFAVQEVNRGQRSMMGRSGDVIPDVMRKARKRTATLFGISLPMSSLTFLTLSALPAAAAPWQSAVVLGSVLKAYYTNSAYELQWHKGWLNTPIVGSLVGIIGFPPFLAVVTIGGWFVSLRTVSRCLSEANVLRRTEQYTHALLGTVYKAASVQRDAFDASNLLIGSELMHMYIQEGQPDMLLGVFLNNADQGVLEEAVRNERSQRFGAKSVFSSALLHLKVSWLMLLLAVPATTLSETTLLEIVEVIIAIALTLYTLTCHCWSNFKLVRGLIVMRGELDNTTMMHGNYIGNGPPGLLRSLLIKQFVLLTLVVMVIAESIVRMIGAFVCNSIRPGHMFGFFSGCS